MNGVHDLYGLLFGFITLSLLIWPFYPAWREWRTPSDAAALTWSEPEQHLPHISPLIKAPEAASPRVSPPPQKIKWVLADLPHAKPWGALGSRTAGDCFIPAGACWPGALVVKGNLHCGANSVVEGDVKVYGHVQMDTGSALLGAVFASSMTLGEEAMALGPVVVEHAVTLAEGASIGNPESPTSVSAASLKISDSARVYGKVRTPLQSARP